MKFISLINRKSFRLASEKDFLRKLDNIWKESKIVQQEKGHQVLLVTI